MEAEYRTGVRLLRIMRAILDRPKGYTLKELADKYSVSKETLKLDIRTFRDAGYLIDYDKRYRYFFVEEQPFRQLRDLLLFSEEDQFLLEQAIDEIAPHSARSQRLKEKLAALYDYRRLGHDFLRKPYLSKVDLLLQAKDEKRKVWLMDYRSSNGNIIGNRFVEPFHPSPPDDMLHAFDVDKNELRHFRISRIKRVKLSEEEWTYEGHHIIHPTDSFRIVDKNQVPVHLRMSVGAYNELTERFPLTRGKIIESSEDEVFDYQDMVNHNFLGLTNFILGHHHQWIEVLEPDSLIKHLREVVRKMEF